MKKAVFALERELKNHEFVKEYKTGEKMRVVLGGVKEEIDVYTIPVSKDLIYYNPDNTRVNTAAAYYKKENGIDTLDPAVIGISEYNKRFDKLIRAQKANEYAALKESIEGYSQMLPGICMADGRILSGNCRFAVIRELQEECDTTEQRIKVGIITNPNYVYDNKEIKLLELTSQNSMNVHSDYDVFNRICDIMQTVLIKELCTTQEYQSTYLSAMQKEYSNDYNAAIELLHLCAFAGIDPSQAYLLERFQVSAPLVECSLLVRKYKQYTNEIREFMFSELMLSRDKNTIQRARSDKRTILTLGDERLMKRLFEEHHQQIAEPVMKAVRDELKKNSDHLNSNDFKAALDERLGQAKEGKRSIKDESNEVAKKWADKAKEEKIVHYPIQASYEALDRLEKIDAKKLERLSTEQLEALHKTLNRLTEVTGALAAEVMEGLAKRNSSGNGREGTR